MQEGSVMEMVKWFLGLFLILGMVSIGMFCLQVQDVNSYKQQINYQIERNGGLTTEAVNNLREYSKKNYQGRFKVDSDLIYQKVSFGDNVDYTIIGTFKIPIFPLPDVELIFNGNGVSQVR
ncbi:hypothetical protein ACWO4B_003234 [Clostridium sporogenes]